MAEITEATEVEVKSHIRKDGTEVKGYKRSRPNIDEPLKPHRRDF